jgi:cytoskeleton protein RodZ
VTAIETRSAGDAAIEPLPAGAATGSGARLRAAREAAGLSVDQVAQQLKLAQRQVRALEDENFAELPGRTFSRGFLRNYARLLNLDADDLLQHLPDAAMAPSLGAPALHSTSAMIAELPSAGVAKRASFARWVIPLALVACIVGAATYEWYRGGLSTLGDGPRVGVQANVPDPRNDGGATTALPNPLANEGAPTTSAAAPAPLPAIVEDKLPITATAAAAEPAPAALEAPPVDAPILLSYSGPSWTEIRDRTGQLLISRLVSARSVENLRGAPPFDLVLGNASAVSLTYRGEPVDLAPYTRGNVARLTLQ